jgi:hypothetical protein
VLVVARAPRGTASRGNASLALRAAPVGAIIVPPSIRPALIVQNTNLPLQSEPQRYVLTGGGPGVGKVAYSGCEVEFVRMNGSGWATVRLASVPSGQLSGSATLGVGDELSWRFSSLCAVLPGGMRAAEAPTRVKLQAAEPAPMDTPPSRPLLKTLPEQQSVPAMLLQLKQQPAQRYELVGGGRSVGKSAYSGCQVEFVATKSGWVTVRVVSLPPGQLGTPAPAVGDELSWRRTSMRAVLPGSVLAAEAPSLADLRAPPQQPLLPPLMPTLLASTESPVARVVVFFDLEYKGGWNPNPDPDGIDPTWTITQMAATAVFVLENGTWGVPPDGRFSTHSMPGSSFKPAAAELNVFLETMSAAAGGKEVVMLAHSGAGCDWPVLTCGLAATGLALPACVTKLGCTRTLFVAELKEMLGRKWSMSAIYGLRFNGAEIPNQHQALGDVWAMERIAVNVVSENGPAWAAAALEATVQSSKSPAQYVAKHEAKYGSARSVVPSPLPFPSAQLQLRSADPVALLAAAPALAVERVARESHVPKPMVRLARQAVQLFVRATGNVA